MGTHLNLAAHNIIQLHGMRKIGHSANFCSCSQPTSCPCMPVPLLPCSVPFCLEQGQQDTTSFANPRPVARNYCCYSWHFHQSLRLLRYWLGLGKCHTGSIQGSWCFYPR